MAFFFHTVLQKPSASAELESYADILTFPNSNSHADSSSSPATKVCDLQRTREATLESFTSRIISPKSASSRSGRSDTCRRENCFGERRVVILPRDFISCCKVDAMLNQVVCSGVDCYYKHPASYCARREQSLKGSGSASTAKPSVRDL